MCQCQLSGSSFPSEADTPPCAATVCERVGNTFDSTATRSPASASSRAARMPEPPAPTTIASNCLVATAILSPQNLHGPSAVHDKSQNHDDVERKPQARVLDVIH